MDKLLFNVSRKVRLSDLEKSTMRERLVVHIRGRESLNQLGEQDRPTSENYREHSRWLSLQIFASRAVFAPILLFIFVLGGGVSFAAEQALPGDLLYPIKRNVNEKMKVIVARSTKSQAMVQVKLAAERLREAEELAHANKLSTETRVSLENDFLGNSINAKAGIARLNNEKRSEDAAEARANLESTLGAHLQVLQTLEARHTDNLELKRILATVQRDNESRNEESVKVDHNKKISNDELRNIKAITRGKLKKIRKEIIETHKFVVEKNKKAGVEAFEDAQVRLIASEEALKMSEDKLESGASSDAATLTHDADRLVKEARILVETSAQLELGGEPAFTNEMQIRATTTIKEGATTSKSEDGSPKSKTREGLSADQPDLKDGIKLIPKPKTGH